MKHLAERRTDIFGVGEDAALEAGIGKKMGEEETKRLEAEKNVWDGHSSTADAAGRAARINVSLNDQIQQIHRNKGLIPDTVKENIGPQSAASGPPMLPPGAVNVVSHNPHPQNVPPQHAPQVIYIVFS